MALLAPTDLYSPREAAQLLGLSERHIRRLIAAEQLKATDVGTAVAPRYIIHGSDLAKLPRARLLERLAATATAHDARKDTDQ